MPVDQSIERLVNLTISRLFSQGPSHDRANATYHAISALTQAIPMREEVSVIKYLNVCVGTVGDIEGDSLVGLEMLGEHLANQPVEIRVIAMLRPDFLCIASMVARDPDNPNHRELFQQLSERPNKDTIHVYYDGHDRHVISISQLVMDAATDQIAPKANNHARVIWVHNMVKQKINRALHQHPDPLVRNAKVELIDPVYLTWKYDFTEVPVAPDCHGDTGGATLTWRTQ